MDQLKQALGEIESSGKQDDLYKHLMSTNIRPKTKAKLDDKTRVAMETVGCSYHLAVIKLNQGLVLGYEPMIAGSIAGFFNLFLAIDISVSEAGKDLTIAKKFYELAHLINPNGSVKFKSIEKLGYIERECLGCGAMFESAGIHNRMCVTCASIGKYHSGTYNNKYPTKKKLPKLPRRIPQYELDMENTPAAELVKLFKRTWQKPSTPNPRMNFTGFGVEQLFTKGRL